MLKGYVYNTGPLHSNEMCYMTTSVYHFLIMLCFSPQPQDDLGPSALDTKTPVTTEDDSGALNLDPYNLQAMFETCGIKP